MSDAEPRHADKPGFLSRIAGVEGRLSVADRNNVLAVLLMGALSPIAGSAISFLLAAFLLRGLVLLALGRLEPGLTRSDRILAWTFTIFAALVLATGLVANDPLRVFGSTVWLLPFLSLWVVIPQLRASPHLDYPHLYITGAIAGCIGALLLLGAQIAWFGSSRFAGGAGNAAVFASMCLCLTGIAGLALDAPERGRRLLAAAAVIAGTAAIIASLTRGVMLALLPVLFLLAVYTRRRWRAIRFSPTTALLLLAIPAIVLYSLRGTIESRIGYTLQEAETLLDGGYTRSAGERLRLWAAAWQAFLDSPLLGHGVQGRMQALYPYLAQDGLQIRDFTHPHNAYLAFAVDGGLLVLTALVALLVVPAAVAWRAPRDEAFRQRLFLALVVATAYAGIGLTQIMFKHDILDSFYIFTAIIIAASIHDPATMRGLLHQPATTARSRAKLAADRLLALVETYLFPAFAFLVVAGGLAQAFLLPGHKEAVLSIFGLSGG